MPTITATMAWEFWVLARLRILSALLGVGCLNALFYLFVTSFLGSLPAAGQRNLFFVIFFTDILLIVLILLRSRDADSRNGMELDTRAFVLPLPTWRLVLLKMFPPVVTAGVLWVAVSALTLAVTPRSTIGESWPMFGPALVAAMFTAWGLAIFYFPLRPKSLKALVGFAIVVRLVVWTVGGSGETARTWSPVAAEEGAALAAFLLAAYVTALLGAVQARRGVTVGFSNLVGIADGWSSRWRRAVRGTFRSPVTAQIWLEWRQKSWILPAISAGLLLAIAILAGRGRNPGSLLPALLILFVFLLFYTPPLMGCLMGRFNQTSRDASIDVFRASRPLGDTAFANVVLTTAALSLALTWGVMVLTSTAILGVFDLLRGGGQLEMAWQIVKGAAAAAGPVDTVLVVAGFLVLNWTNMALVASAFLTGRNKVVTAVVFVPYGLGVCAFVVFQVLGEETIGGLFVVAAWVLSVAALGLTVAAFAVARRRRLIGERLPWVALALALGTGLGFTWGAADRVSSIVNSGVALERAVLVLGPGLLALAVAPLALAPLALAWNRHR